MGGAVRAQSNSLEALYLNPANIATARVYHLAAGAQIWPEARRQSYGGGAIDSILNRQRIAGGLAVNYSSQDPDGLQRRSLDLRFALAIPISDVLFIGAAVKHLRLSQDGVPASVGLEPSAAAAGLHDNRILTELTFDAGVTLKPIEQLAFSIVGSNLTDPGTGLMPLLLGGGVGFGTGMFSIEVDGSFDFTTYDKMRTRIMGGAELLVADAVPIRAGYRYDEGLGSHALSGGLGYTAPEFAIDVGVRRTVDGPTSTTVVVGFRYHLEGAGIVSPDM